MASFKPKNSGNAPSGDFEPRNLPTPRAGLRKARVSLIIDLGTQNREDFEEDDGTKKPQKPCQQVVVFADLVADKVDYGGKIGVQQYRMLLNKSFQGVPVGINFTTVPPKDGDGNIVKGKPWTLHPANLLTKIAKAVGEDDVIYDDRKNAKSLDISLLLDKPFMVNVEVKKTPATDKATGAARKDKEGNPIVYTNVNFKGAVPVPEDDDGNPQVVAELTQPALCITFDTVTVEELRAAKIRPSIIKQIKLANDYAGSAMQKAVEAYEAELAGGDDDDGEQDEAPAPKQEAPKAKREPAKPKAKPAAAPASGFDDMDDDIPF